MRRRSKGVVRVEIGKETLRVANGTTSLVWSWLVECVELVRHGIAAPPADEHVNIALTTRAGRVAWQTPDHGSSQNLPR